MKTFSFALDKYVQLSLIDSMAAIYILLAITSKFGYSNVFILEPPPLNYISMYFQIVLNIFIMFVFFHREVCQFAWKF
jgi:hypothetical protein